MNPRTYQAIAIKHGLKFYAKTGQKPNRAWNLLAMLKTAGSITGQTYGRKEIPRAVDDLTTWLKENNA